MIVPSDFLSQAKRLLGDGKTTSEVDCRSAISRAYYSLFHETRDYFTTAYKKLLVDQIIVDLNIAGKKGFDFARVDSLDWNYLQRFGINAHSILYRLLRQLDRAAAKDLGGFRDRRNSADYELAAELKPEVSKTEVEAMEKLVELIKRL